ncbi:MAG: 2-amino-4-hydroxy-6-hydroxymethyldihydropteridine diphosphokinase [Myxococcales bacterium]
MRSKSKESASCATPSSRKSSPLAVGSPSNGGAQVAQEPAVYYVGLGSNLGDRCRNLAQAVHLLSRCEGVQVSRRSSLYDSAPIGPEQPRYLNAVVEVRTTLKPMELLRACKAIEKQLGREDSGRWGPRSIDLDLLFSDAIVAEPALQVPHLQLHKRAFALAPLCELDPELRHPILRSPLRLLLNDVSEQDVHRVGDFYVDC